MVAQVGQHETTFRDGKAEGCPNAGPGGEKADGED